MTRRLGGHQAVWWGTHPHGDGQTILREAILIVDHTSYHVGEFAILRQVVNNWK